MRVVIEGLSADEFLALPDDEINDLVFTGEPLTFRAGSAEILGQFELHDDRLVVELAHIEGGGEGVLLALSGIGRRLAQIRGIPGLEWIVHATNCARPNSKLLRVLKRRGFQVADVEGRGNCYHRFEKA